MSELSKAIVQKVFQALDIVQVLRFLDYRTDTIQETSKSVRCFCPVHKEQIFRTYTFEPRTGKGRCSYTPCPAHAPHDIIGLTALYHGVDYETATEKLVEHFQLRVAVTEEEAATSPLLAAHHDLENGKTEEAYQSFTAIVAEEPRNVEALLGLVKACAALGRTEERATLQLQLAELYTSKRMWEDAANTYALYLEYNLEDIPTRLRYAECLHHLERKTQMMDEMMRIAELFEKRQEWEKAFEIYKRVEIFRPGVIETQEAMEELLAKMGRTDEAAVKILKRAEEYRKQDDMDKALDCYARVVELDPARDDMRQLFIEGVLARTKPKREDLKQCLELLDGFSATTGQSESLSACLERLLDRFPDNKSLHEKALQCAERIEAAGFNQRALVIYEKLRACGFRPADLDGAIQRLLVQSGRGEEVIERLEKQAEEYLSQGKLPEALSCYVQILEITPDRDDIRQKYLNAVLASPEVDEAIVNQCVQMVDSFTSGPTGDDVLGMLAKILQRFRDNAAMLDKALQTGKILESEGDIDKALEVYRLAAEAQPDLEDARLAIEKALIESGRKNEAIENVVMQAESHLRSGQIPEAVGLFAKALDMDPGRDDLRLRSIQGVLESPEAGEAVLAQSLALLEGFKDMAGTEAMACLTSLLERFPRHSVLQNKAIQAGRMAQEGGETACAIEMYRLVLSLDPAHGEANRALEEALLAEGQIEEAVANMLAQADLFLAEGRLPDALGRFQSALERVPEREEVVCLYLKALLTTPKMGEGVIVQCLEAVGHLAAWAASPAILELIEQLHERFPNHMGVKRHLQDCCRAQGREPEANGLALELAQAAFDARDFGAATQWVDLLIEQGGSLRQAALKLKTEISKALGGTGAAVDAFLAAIEQHESKGMRNEVVAFYKTAIEMNPDSIELRLRNLRNFRVLGRMEEYFEAAQATLALLNTTEDRLGAQVALDELLGVWGEIEKEGLQADVTPLYAAAVRVRPEDVELRRVALRNLLALERTDAYFEMANETLALLEEQAEAPGTLVTLEELLGAAETFEKVGLLAEVAPLYQTAIGISPENLSWRLRALRNLLTLERTGDYCELAQETLPVLEKQAETDEARAAMAELLDAAEALEKQGLLEEVAPFYQTAVVLAPENLAWQMRRLRNLLALGRTDTYCEVAPETLALLEKQAATPEAQGAMAELLDTAETLEKQGRIEEVRPFYDVAVGVAPENLAWQLRRLRNLLALKRTEAYCDAAEPVLVLLEKKPGKSESLAAMTELLEVAEIFEKENRRAEVTPFYATSVLVDSENLSWHLRRLRNLAALNLSEAWFEAAHELMSLLEHATDLDAVLVALDELDAYVADKPEALTHRCDYLLLRARRLTEADQATEARDAAFKAADLYYDADQTEKSVEILESLLENDPHDLGVKERLGDWYLSLDRVEEALNCFRSLAQVYAENGSTDMQLDMLLKISEIAPGNLEVLGQLLTAHERMGNTRDARETRLRMAELFLSQGEFESAQVSCRDVLAGEPECLAAWELCLQIHEAAGDQEAFHHDALLLLEIHLKANASEEAAHLIERLEAFFPGDPQVFALQVRILCQEGKWEDAVALLKTVLEECAGEKDFARSLRLLQSILGLSDSLDEELVQPWVDVCCETGTVEEHWEEIERILNLSQRQKSLGDTVNALRQIIASAPDFEPARTMQIALLEEGGLNRRAAEAIQDWAWFCRNAGRSADALQHYGAALELLPDDVDLLGEMLAFRVEAGLKPGGADLALRLADLHEAAGLVAQAVWAIESGLKLDPRRDDLRERALALDEILACPALLKKRYSEICDRYVQEEEWMNAQTVLLEAIRHFPMDLELRGSLVTILEHVGLEEEILAELMNIAEILSETNEFAAALETVNKALEKWPGDGRAQAIYAEIQARMGDEKGTDKSRGAASRHLHEEGASQTGEEEEEGAVVFDSSSLTILPVLPDYTFEHFVVGARNNFAHATARAIAANPGGDYNPLFLHGDVGLGKTHLIQAILIEIRNKKPDLRVLYTSTEEFINALIEAIQNNTIRKFRALYKSPDVLLIDDVHGLAEKERAQEEFFQIFNSLYQANRQIVMTSDRPPKDIAHLERRLRSRFGAGIIVDIQPPDFETRMAILRHEADALEGLHIQNEVLRVLAQRVESNVRDLKSALNQIVARMRIAKQEPTPQMVEQILESMGKS